LVVWSAYKPSKAKRKEEKKRQITNLLLYYLDDILVLKAMAEPTMLWIVPRTGSPYKHIFHILEQASVDMIAEVFNCTTTSILMAQKRTSDRLFPLFLGIAR
jgi:hypothetical protein